ncbi:pullulanase-type alpha-1,6-glucosidase [Actinomyces trachealis]|uniref:pullulanase-type alpha-1,6-glucosidase n=1 Tax=Actinomyces trachealis TaxID=2763540 RepID=UPI001892C855|nr:pullulanase-type alpha-1,6-glucosidase [Actinomyces trachealis]
MPGALTQSFPQRSTSRSTRYPGSAGGPTPLPRPLRHARAIWLEPDLIAWPRKYLPTHLAEASADQVAAATDLTLSLLTSPEGGLRLSAGISDLSYQEAETPLRILGDLPAEQLARHPHLQGYLALSLTDADGTPRFDADDVRSVLTGQVAVVVRSHQPLPGGSQHMLTGVQLWALLDHFYGAAADRTRPLGVTFHDGRPAFYLWAPTARTATLLTWETGDPTGSVPLAPGAPTRTPATRGDDGVWSVGAGAANAGCQYLWELELHIPATGRTGVNRVTDPYSRALTTDSRRSVAVDLNGTAGTRGGDADRALTAPTVGTTDQPAAKPPTLVPEIWATTCAPAVAKDAARVIYELHLRDFSAADQTVPAELRGTYRAFSVDSTGTRHLRRLAEAGVDTLHLLPVFDFTTVPEDRAEQFSAHIPDFTSPATHRPQAEIGRIRRRDSYNWGYDPWHWMAPEGSYATPGHQDGGARVAELREAIGAIHALGLQVVLDQVYNHTAASGQDPHSVLDRIVPGYYHRLDANGAVCTSASGANVATEHAMAERLMIDAAVAWVRDYRVDGLRFDLMGYHSVDTMRRLREALAEVQDTVGHEVFLYGEGWNMGEVQDNARFTQAIQGQVNGLHLATFNDRLRDAVHGGFIFDADPRAHQGFGTGELTAPNGHDERPAVVTRRDLGWRADLLRAGLAGNLADYCLIDADGHWRRAAELGYCGGVAAYGAEPIDSLAYVSSHDDNTLFDLLAYKLPVGMPMSERVRMNTVALACVTLSQSPVLWGAGCELLRSKSLDRDSYDSGDWFNAIDWTGTDNGWGRGLPAAWRNFDRWLVQAELLARPELRPTSADITAAREGALDLLRLRRSTPLLTLGSAALIHERVSFPCAGPGATPGVVVMVVDDGAGDGDVDPALDGVLVAINATPEPVERRVDALLGRRFQLSPVQAQGFDERVRESWFNAQTGTFYVPARTVTVFFER